MRHLAFLVFLVAGPSIAFAGQISSIYSDFDLKKCKALELYNGNDEGEGGVWECKGIEGFDVLYLEGDLRGFAAFGPEARSQCTSAQTFGAFNSPGPRIEWRMEIGKPIATIFRWLTDNGSGEEDAKRNWLVVTKLNGKDACRTALIDTTYPNANAVAREKADKSSRSFNCEKDVPEVVSQRAIKAGEIMTGAPCPGGPYREE
jgi:hypothetical protein